MERWYAVFSRPLVVRDNHSKSVCVLGALCPHRAVGAAIIMPTVSGEAMSEHLKEIGAQATPAGHAVLLCDGAE